MDEEIPEMVSMKGVRGEEETTRAFHYRYHPGVGTMANRWRSLEPDI